MRRCSPSRRRTTSTSRRCSRLLISRIPPAPRRASSRSRRRSPRRSGTARRAAIAISTYNKLSRAQLAAATPAYDWNAYLTAAGLSKATDVVVGQPDYVKAMNDIIANTPVSTWREYLTFKLLDDYADELPAAFQHARFEFRDKTLSGQQEMSPRWKRAVDEVERRAGRGGGQALRRAVLQARSEGAHGRAGEEHPRRVQGRHRQSRVDVARDQAAGAGQARALHREDRLSRQVARLLEARHQARRSVRQRDAHGASSGTTTWRASSASRSIARAGA